MAIQVDGAVSSEDIKEALLAAQILANDARFSKEFSKASLTTMAKDEKTGYSFALLMPSSWKEGDDWVISGITPDNFPEIAAEQ